MELPWHAVELGLACMKRSMSAQLWQSTMSRWSTQRVDTDKAFEEEPMQIRSRIVAREFKSGDRPDLHERTPPLEALNAIEAIASRYSPELSLMHVDFSVHTSTPRLRGLCW